MKNDRQSEPVVIQPRNQFFTGRKAELNRLACLLKAGKPLTVLNVCGHSGVGKTWLLEEYCHLCQAAQVPFAYLTADDLRGSPISILIGWAKRLGLPAVRTRDSLMAIEFEQTLSNFALGLCSLQEPTVVLMQDNYVKMRHVDAQVRQLVRCLARNGAPTGSTNGPVGSRRSPRVILVIGSRTPLENRWPLNPLYRRFLQTVTLLDFTFPETCDYLNNIGVPERHHHTIFRWTRGYPMALALATTLDTWPEADALMIDEILPSVEREHLVRGILKRATDGDLARTEIVEVLRASALVRSFDQRLLAVMMGQGRLSEDRLSDDLFDQVTALAMVIKRRREDRSRLFSLHPMLREAVLADAARRGLDKTLETYRRLAFNFYTSRRPSCTKPDELLEWGLDVLFLHSNPAIHQLFFQDVLTSPSGETASFHELETVLGPLMRDSVLYEDMRVTGLALDGFIEDTYRWLTLDWDLHGETLEYFRAIRHSDGEIAGFSLIVPLTDDTLPTARQATLGRLYEAYVGPLESEKKSYFAFGLVIDSVENLPLIMRVVFRQLIMQTCQRFIIVLSWPLLRMLAEELGFTVLREGIEHAGRHYAILELDMARYGDLLGWLLRLIREDLDMTGPQMPWQEFIDSLRKVLPDLWMDVQGLSNNPLVDELHLAAPGMAMDRRAEALVQAIREAAEMLRPLEEDGGEEDSPYSYYAILDALYGLSKNKSRKRSGAALEMRPLRGGP